MRPRAKTGWNWILLLSFILLICTFVWYTNRASIRQTAIYPNPTYTPGEVFPDATADSICKIGYTKSVRNVSTATKKLVYQEYGVAYGPSRGKYEVDHFIPLELGGSNDLTNLFLEPAEPRPGYHEKDVVENYLHDQVCRHGMDLAMAQAKIRTDWYAVYKQIPNPGQFKY